MNKAEFVSYISSEHNLSKTEAEKSLDMITDAITAALAKNEEITIVGFGSFKIQERAARVGRNPKTGEALNIAASKSPVFKAGKFLKDACNK
ncbi:MAG: HU family DNA-binding protein [Rickettsiaceae bacterium]|nr:HU family DNA-binding protein [Rickettsiaceae bacterium]